MSRVLMQLPNRTQTLLLRGAAGRVLPARLCAHQTPLGGREWPASGEGPSPCRVPRVTRGHPGSSEGFGGGFSLTRGDPHPNPQWVFHTKGQGKTSEPGGQFAPWHHEEIEGLLCPAWTGPLSQRPERHSQRPTDVCVWLSWRRNVLGVWGTGQTAE